MEMLRAGVFDDWTKKSLERLTELMPGRYAKPEMSIGFLTDIETYAYRSPLSPAATPATGNAVTTTGANNTPSTTGNVNTTGKTDPMTGNANTTSKPDSTTGSANAMPSKPDQTTQPAAQPADKGMVKHGTFQ
jgi:hypothetical protein